MKKTVVSILSAILVACLAGCSGGANAQATTTADETTAATTADEAATTTGEAESTAPGTAAGSAAVVYFSGTGNTAQVADTMALGWAGSFMRLPRRNHIPARIWTIQTRTAARR